jgi:predicted DNA-binding transcriptional regulator YafY
VWAPPKNARRGRQILRQWKLLRSLEAARRGLSPAELRDAVEEICSPRTIYRDLEQLQSAGFPLSTENGRWRVLKSGEGAWSVPVQPTQVLALALSEELLAPVEGSWLAHPLRELRSELSAMLTPVGRAYLRELKRTAVATLFAPGNYRHHSATMDAIQEAIEKQHRLRIRYSPPRRSPQERIVEPYCTWYAAGRVYLIAHCRMAGDIRTFAIQRIEEAQVLDEEFEPSCDFDPAAYARATFGVYQGPIHHVVVDFDDEVSYLLRERRYHHTQRVTPIENGVRLTMDAAGLPEIASWLAGFGGHARAIAPAELVAAVREIHKSGLEAHSK